MEYIMAWHLIYRNGPQLGALLPVDARPEFCSVKADITGVNVFCEVNKPPHD
jgi:extracellular factor (EF) 3-hydroxypalmitic acid methyl ester biosynthesis protein